MRTYIYIPLDIDIDIDKDKDIDIDIDIDIDKDIDIDIEYRYIPVRVALSDCPDAHETLSMTAINSSMGSITMMKYTGHLSLAKSRDITFILEAAATRCQ